MKKILFVLPIVCAVISLHDGADAAQSAAGDDSVRLEHIIVTLLMPTVREAVSSFYEPYLTVGPTVVSYYASEIVGIQGAERVREGVYGSHFAVTVEVFPYVGPHLSVGKDRITISVKPDGTTAVEEFQHLESHSLPPNYQSLIKAPLP